MLISILFFNTVRTLYSNYKFLHFNEFRNLGESLCIIYVLTNHINDYIIRDTARYQS